MHMNKCTSLLRKSNATSQFRFTASQPGSSGGSAVLKLTGLTAIVGGGVFGYSLYDEKFRNTIIKTVPEAKTLYDAVLGPSQKNKAVTDHGSLPTPLFPAAPLPTKSKESKESAVKKELDASTNIPAPTGKPNKVPLKNPYLGPGDELEKNLALTQNLTNALETAENSVRISFKAKLATIRAIEHHVQTIREAVESGPGGCWDSVRGAHSAALDSAKQDGVAEEKAREKIEELKTIVNLGMQGETTQLNPLLSVSKETIRKLENELKEASAMIKQVETEKLFVNNYRHVVEEGRKRFANELKAVLPEFKWDGKEKMKKAQMNTLLAHAHLRVDQLLRKLADQKLREADRIRTAVSEEMKINAARSAEDGAVVAVAASSADVEKEVERRMSELTKKYNADLEQVVRTQKQLYDIEHKNDIENAVAVERAIYEERITTALFTIQGIEEALKKRVLLDVENRRSKQLWLAVQNLVDSIEYGKRSVCCMEGRRLPLNDQLKVLASAAGDDPFMNVVQTAVPKVSRVRGEYTKEDLKTRFDKVYRVGRRIAHMDENGGGVAGHLLSYVRSLLTFRLPIDYSKHAKFDGKNESNIELLERARFHMCRGEIDHAIRLLQATTGPLRRHAADFIVDARRHEEALLLSRLMLAHAAVNSIRSTY